MKARLRASVARWASATSFPTEAAATAIAATVLLAVTAVLWLAPLRSSFWLDEAVTMWTIRGTFAETMARLANSPAQPSLPFSVIMWLTAKYGGGSELTMRLPSIVAMAVATFGVYRIGRRFMDRFPAVVAVMVFATFKTIAFAAADARPYALPLACVVWAMYCLIRWTESRNIAFGLAYAALAALSVHLHYTAATMLAVNAFYIVALNRDARPTAPQLWTVAAALALLLTPIAAFAISLWQARGSHSFAMTPVSNELVVAFVYTRLVILFGGSWIVARYLNDAVSWKPGAVLGKWDRVLLVWFVVPVLALFLVSVFSDAKVFIARYYIWSVPGMALLAGALVAAIEPRRARLTIGLVLVVALGFRRIPSGPAAHGGEDWRGALAAAGAEMTANNAPLLLQPGLAEAVDGPSLTPSATTDLLLFPLVPYPVTGDVFLIPSGIQSETQDKLEALVSTRLIARREIVMLSRANNVSTDLWLRGRLRAAGFVAEPLGRFAGINALVWRRAGD